MKRVWRDTRLPTFGDYRRYAARLMGLVIEGKFGPRFHTLRPSARLTCVSTIGLHAGQRT